MEAKIGAGYREILVLLGGNRASKSEYGGFIRRSKNAVKRRKNVEFGVYSRLKPNSVEMQTADCLEIRTGRAKRRQKKKGRVTKH